MNAPRRLGFGLVEMTITVTVAGVFALFAIPRYEAHSEAPRTREAVKFGRDVVRLQAARLDQSKDFARHLEQLGVVSRVPEGFHIAEMYADGQRSWSVVIERLGDEGEFGAYQLIFDRAGFNPVLSTVPKGLLPKLQRSMMR